MNLKKYYSLVGVDTIQVSYIKLFPKIEAMALWNCLIFKCKANHVHIV